MQGLAAAFAERCREVFRAGIRGVGIGIGIVIFVVLAFMCIMILAVAAQSMPVHVVLMIVALLACAQGAWTLGSILYRWIQKIRSPKTK